MRQIRHSDRAIVPNAGSKVASHTSEYALWRSTPPSLHSLTQSISPVSPLAHQDSTLQRTCGSSVSLARWVMASSACILVQRVDSWTLEGMTHAPTFNRATTHLLCPSAVGAKYDKAQVWGTPVVDMRWLSHIAMNGALPPHGMFLVPDSHAPYVETSDVNIVQEGTTASPQFTQPAVTPPPEATQPDADSAKRGGSFGRSKPHHSPDEVIPSSSPTHPPASSSPSSSHLPPSSLSAHPSVALSSHSSGKTSTPGGDTDDDEAAQRVPSSNTPSPLKLPREQTDPAARALHESISNLLGKRNAGAIAIEDHAETPRRRKRARPRSKVSQGLPFIFSCHSRDRVFFYSHTCRCQTPRVFQTSTPR